MITKKHTLIVLSTAVAEFTFAMLIFFFPLYFKEELGLSGGQIGLLYALGQTMALLTILPAGFMNDRVLSKRIATFGGLLVALAYFFLPSVGSFQALLPIFLGLTFGRIIFMQSLETLIHKKRETDQRGGYYGTFQFWKSTAIAIGMITGGILLFSLSFSNIFYISAAIYTVLVLISLYLPVTEIGKMDFSHYKKDLANINVVIFLIVLFMFALHFGAEATSYGLFLRENLGLNKLQMGLYMSGELVGLGLAAFFLGRAVDAKKIKPTTPFIIGLSLSGLMHIAMTVPNVWLSFLFRTIHGVGDGAMFLFFYLGVSYLFTKERIGGNNGAISLTVSIGAMLGSLLFGPMGESLGYHYPLIVSGLLEIIGLVFILIFLRKRFIME